MVARFCKRDDQTVKDLMRQGKLDVFNQSCSDLHEEILFAMSSNRFLDCVDKGFPDKRKANSVIPSKAIITSVIAAKMQAHQKLTDATFAIRDHRLLEDLGYNIIDGEGKLPKYLFKEGTVRHLLTKYESEDFVRNYNSTVQDYILPKLDASPNIHILDCTKIPVNIKNKNYEGAGLVKDLNGNYTQGYKLAALRGLFNDTGIIEEICFGSINIHDLELSKDMVCNSKALKPGDILICDRGFLSREFINYMKNERKVNMFIPLRKNMIATEMAIEIAKLENKWRPHPNPKRMNQKITFVSNIGPYYEAEKDGYVDLNACVVYDETAKKEENKYFVFVTTDLAMSAEMIVKTYELRTEIEEDFRQIKDFWKIEDFCSTKFRTITFHIICTLLGYLFWQIYKTLPEGKECVGKCLPVLSKSYISKENKYYICYVEDKFGIFMLTDYCDFFASCSEEVRAKLKWVMNKKKR